jgi:L-seryl-tRNA(Ser) seleniumtransferase
MVTLDTIAKGGEAIVSRGQLVEIGGSFRIPDIIESSDAVLKEVGATNKTHLKDYEKAINETTSCLLQVHPSNYHMTGFVEEVSTAELAKLAHSHNLPLVYDLGSGCLYPFAAQGVGREPLPPQIIADGADVLTFSGDKLLGSAQGGIIVGKKKYLAPIMKNQMLRALRVDKMTLGALEATLELYRDGREKEIPTVAMLTATEEELKNKAETLQKALTGSGIKATVTRGLSPVGGGSMPDVELPAWVVEVIPGKTGIDEILKALRSKEPAVLAYVHEDKLCFNARTVSEEELPVLIQLVKEVLA